MAQQDFPIRVMPVVRVLLLLLAQPPLVEVAGVLVVLAVTGLAITVEPVGQALPLASRVLLCLAQEVAVDRVIQADLLPQAAAQEITAQPPMEQRTPEAGAAQVATATVATVVVVS